MRFVSGVSMLSVSLLVGGCTSQENSSRPSRVSALSASTILHVREFNPVTSVYTERPTSVFVEELSNGKRCLGVTMARYALPEPIEKMNLPPRAKQALRLVTLRFDKENVPRYVDAIDKYLAWEAIARERRDAFTKEIGRAATFNYAGSEELQFTFHSGNQENHYLSVDHVRTEPTYEDNALYFDRDNATELKRVLQAYVAGTLPTTNLNAVYK